MAEFVKPRQENASLEFVVVEKPVERGSPEALALKFQAERQGNAKLEFNTTGTGTLPTVELSGSVRTRAPGIEGIALNGAYTTGTLDSQDQPGIEGITLMCADYSGTVDSMDTPGTNNGLVYDINVDRDPKGEFGTKHSVAAFQDSYIAQAHSESGFEMSVTKARHAVASKSDLPVKAGHGESPKSSVIKITDYQDGRKLDRDRRNNWQNPPARYERRVHHWRQGRKTDADLGSNWQNPPGMYADRGHHHQEACDGFLVDRGTKYAEGRKTGRYWGDYFEQAILPPDGKHPELPPVEPPVERPPVLLDFKGLRKSNGHLEFVYIELDALIVMNEITVKHVAPDGTETPIHPTQARVGIDLDNYTWTLSGELKGEAALQFLRHQEGEAPVIKMEINGWDWIFVVTSFNRNRGTFNVSYSFQADSQTRYLGEPFALKSSNSVDNPISPWQMVEQQINPLGFELDRQDMLDWTLTGGSYSYSQLTPIALLKAVTAAVGGIVRPDRQEAKLKIQPRYKVSPWKWNTLVDVACDHLVPESVVVTESAQDTSTQQVNAITVGGTTHGVVTQVVLNGTAGDVSGQDVSDPLAQSHQVNAERGRNAMGETGSQESVNYSIPLMQEGVDSFGLITPGDIVRIVNQDGSKLTGLCISNNINLKTIDEVWQEVSLEIHNGNT